jgi:hypothetical protein
MLFKFGRFYKTLKVKGTCSGALRRQGDKPYQHGIPTRSMLSVTDDSVLKAAALGQELDGIPEDLLSEAVFLNDDGTIVETSTNATEGDASSAISNRRLKTWGRHDDKDDEHDDDDDDDDDSACPRGWKDSKRPCDVTGCGTCCIRKFKH